MHPLTKERVIQRELLFQVGDTLDMQLMAETERSLRTFRFLGSADVSIDTVLNDSVSIVVHTADQWTLLPSPIIESGGGLNGFGVSIEDSNFLGRGKTIYLKAFNESDIGTSYTAAVYDPRFFGTRWKSALGLNTGPVRDAVVLAIHKPYFSSDSKWTYGVSGLYNNEIQRQFVNGQEFSRSGYKRRLSEAFVGYAYGKRYNKKRVKLQYRYESRDYIDLGDQTNTEIPEDELIAATTISYSIEKESFVKEFQIDNFLRKEDIVLGRKTLFSLGKAGFPVPVGKDHWELEIDHKSTLKLNNDNYLYINPLLTSWMSRNTIAEMVAQYYWQTTEYMTLAFNAEFTYAWNLDLNRQFVLGGNSGLRGYQARAFGGDKRFVANLESRLFPKIKFLTLALGGVAFVDGGFAWERDVSMDFKNLKYSAGVGLRIGLTKFPGAGVLRVDVGWPIDQPGGPQLTLGTDQHFIAFRK